jgi:hypothetical protein
VVREHPARLTRLRLSPVWFLGGAGGAATFLVLSRIRMLERLAGSSGMAQIDGWALTGKTMAVAKSPGDTIIADALWCARLSADQYRPVLLRPPSDSCPCQYRTMKLELDWALPRVGLMVMVAAWHRSIFAGLALDAKKRGKLAPFQLPGKIAASGQTMLSGCSLGWCLDRGAAHSDHSHSG